MKPRRADVLSLTESAETVTYTRYREIFLKCTVATAGCIVPNGMAAGSGQWGALCEARSASSPRGAQIRNARATVGNGRRR